jgi:DNA helicase HerA-like ATPase
MSATSDARRIGVWGRSGSGKSSYVKKLLKSQKRLVIFDPLAEYGQALHVRTVEHRARNSLDEVRQAMIANWAGFRVAYVPPAGKEAAALSAQQPFKDGKRGAKMLTLVVEEMNLSFPVAGGAQKCPGFADVCSRGRHYGIEIIGVSQRIAEVATRFRNNCDETVVLAQKGPRDLDAAAAELGGDKAAVKSLANLEYIHERHGVLKRGKITFPKAANSRRAPGPKSKRA